MSANQILEMRLYRLHHGRSAEFVARFQQRILPLLERHGIEVVYCGLSLHNADCFCLLRAFESVEQRETALDAAKADTEWLAELEPEFHDTIVTTNTFVLPADDRMIETLTAGLRAAGPVTINQMGGR